MAKPLRALIVEDSADDAELLVRELELGGYDVTFSRVETAERLAEALDRDEWDVMFADYTMPRFRGTDALAMVRARGFDHPFIFVSGTMGEDMAVEAMRSGADDYVIKGNLKRLMPAVERALRDAVVRRERQRIEAERHEAEDALRASQERQRLLFEHIADAILVLDRDGLIRFASTSVRAVLGHDPERLMGQPCFDLLHPDDVESARNGLTRVTRRPDAVDSVEVRMRHNDGSWRTTDWALRNLVDHSDIRGLVVTCRDITERKRLETEVLQAQKLESVGRLAGGIAHDFNNLLTVIIGHVDMMRADSKLSSEGQKDLDEIRHAARRASELTRQLLAFSRRQVFDMRPVDINQVVANLTQMLRRVLGEEIEVTSQPARELGTVRADIGQMEQVLLNLAVNARDAMPDGGGLTIETANVQLDWAHAELHPSVTPGRYVLLTVSDTGVGMGAEALAHLFEPFFTTKPAGKGTGLGLATVYGIVKQSGGHIWVYSELGLGTTFKIYLPRVDEPAEGVQEVAAPEPARGGAETILLVEDEAAVLKVAARALRAQGYTVLAAGRAKEAERWLADREQNIDLLLTDALMPGMGGKELSERARAMRPDLPVLFMSGYATPVLTRRGILKPGVALLRKPFTAASLARRVREVLDRQP